MSPSKGLRKGIPDTFETVWAFAAITVELAMITGVSCKLYGRKVFWSMPKIVRNEQKRSSFWYFPLKSELLREIPSKRLSKPLGKQACPLLGHLQTTTTTEIKHQQAKLGILTDIMIFLGLEQLPGLQITHAGNRITSISHVRGSQDYLQGSFGKDTGVDP